MAKFHLKGLVNMLEHNGGTHTLGLNGFLERLVLSFIKENEICAFCQPPTP